jgi:hypothetical protein
MSTIVRATLVWNGEPVTAEANLDLQPSPK